MSRSLVKFSPFTRASHLMAMMTREDALRKLQPVVESFQKYHQHEVEGLKELPQKGGMLFVVNHSLATYDIILLMLAIYKETERLPRPLIDRLFFKIPLVKELVAKLGAVEGSPDVAKGLLDADEIVTVAPGGMFEALRSYKERYQIRWNKRYGFARLAMKAGKPVILAACPKADDMYQVYPSHLTSWIYQTYKIPFFIARGIGPTPIPRPVKLVHYLSEPIHPPKMPKGAKAQEAAIQKFHGHLVDRMETLMAHAVQQQQPVTSP